MTTNEEMAIAVLRGDMGAAAALADSLREQAEEGLVTVPPVKRVKVQSGRFHVIAYVSNPEAEVDTETFRGSVVDWIQEGGVLICQGIDRVELYELPE